MEPRLKIEDSYFKGETRWDFYVSSEMKHAWAAQMELLEDVRAVCERHNIRYFADWGTLLGAVRHKGFIPWDDDIDICMLRQDLREFLKYAPTELPSGYHILNPHLTDGYRDLMTRVINNNGIDWSEQYLHKFHGCPYVCGIDIFCLDYVPRDEGDREALYQLTVAIDHTLALIWNSEYNDMKAEAVRGIEEACGIHFDWTKPLDRQLLEFADDVVAMYSADDADGVGDIPVMGREKHMQPVSLEAFAKVEMMPFEDIIEVPVPIGYDEVLSKKYIGDWREVVFYHPHDYPFFNSQKEQIRQTLLAHPELKKELARFLEDEHGSE